MEHLEVEFCPVCKHEHVVEMLKLKDHFLSGESFRLQKCMSCDLVFTDPRPSLMNIGAYYKSDNYVSHSSTKKGVVNRIYNMVRSFTLNRKFKLINALTEGKDLLDIGAGTGHFLAKMSAKGYTAIGLEPDEDARKVSRETHQLDLLPLETLFELSAHSFDVITMWHVLEHVYDLQKDLSQIISLIKPGGVFVVAVPNYLSYDAHYYGEYWAAYDVPRHLYHFEPKSIRNLVEPHGVNFEKMLPMKFDSYYVSLLSEKYRGGSFINALRIGFLSNWKSKNGKCSSQIYIFRK